MNVLKHTYADLEAGHNTLTNGQFLEIAGSVYGDKKVRDICSRYNIFHPQESTKKLKIKDLKKLQVGLEDIKAKDLDRLVQKMHFDEPLSVIELTAFNALRPDQKAALKKYNDASDLPPELFNDLITVYRSAFPRLNKGLKSSLALSKISGIPGKYFQHGWFSHRSGQSLEDAERLRIYEEIEKLSHNDQARYCELMSKILVKKHLYYEKQGTNELKLGMLVPGLKGPDGQPRWYRISEILDTGWGKFGYRLVPATKAYPSDMPDFLLYRSSATLPTSNDSFTSYLSDLNVLPPGYLSRNRSKQKEVRWFTESTPCADGGTRPLLVTGHSLGAANSQIALMNLQKSGQWPDRKISLELFDSPAIAASDAKNFAKHYNSSQPLSFNYYVSKNDLVPYAGSLLSSSYLGNYIQGKDVTATVHQMELTKKGEKKDQITCLGPHGRIFFRGKDGRDYKDVKVDIDVFDKKTKRIRVLINIQRLVTGIFTWGVLGSIGGIKRFFFGRRHHDPVIKQLFIKALRSRKVERQQSHIEKQIQNISHKRDIVEIELLTLTLAGRQEIEQKVNECISACKEQISHLKNNRNLKSFKREMKSLRKLRADFKRLQQVIQEKYELLETRERLYGSEQLSSLPNFQQHLRELAKDPNLTEGCRHLQNVLRSQMKMSDTPLSEKDVKKLEEFHAKVEPLDEDFAQLVATQVKNIKNTLQKKQTLLVNLSHEIFADNPVELSTEQKIKLFVRAEQILSNPFETRIDSLSFLKSLAQKEDPQLRQLIELVNTELSAKSIKKKGFWDVVSPLEKKAHSLAETTEQKDYLYQCKMEGLRAIAKPVSDENEALIVGAGPSGIMHAISLTLNGRSYQIIELRPEQKRERDNVIVLGKDDPKDVRILLFLGLIAEWDRDQKITLGRYRDSMVEVKIADVENSLKSTLKEMKNGDPHIVYNKSIVSIDNVNGKAKVKISDGAEINPSLIYVTDGFSSGTRKMLGISREALSKTTQIIYSIFHPPVQPPTKGQRLKYRITSRVKALTLAMKVGLYALVRLKSLKTAYGAVTKGGPSALFRIPNQDYTGRSAREEERNLINSYRNKIKKIDRKLSRIQNDPIQRSKLEQRKGKINAELQAYLTKQAESSHVRLDALHGTKRRAQHHVQPMTVSRNVVVDVTITKAERSFAKIGSTPVFIRGDASHSTDPASGYGCKTALEETLADQFTLSNESLDQMNDIEMSCQQWGHRHYLDTMVNKGLMSRFMDVKQSELFERYIDLGAKEALLTEKEGQFLSQCALKSEKKVRLSEKELSRAKNLRLKMIQALKRIHQRRTTDPNYFKDFKEPSLSSSENAILRKMLKQIFKNPKEINAKDAAKMDPIVAKLCYNDVLEGTVLALILKILTR